MGDKRKKEVMRVRRMLVESIEEMLKKANKMLRYQTCRRLRLKVSQSVGVSSIWLFHLTFDKPGSACSAAVIDLPMLSTILHMLQLTLNYGGGGGGGDDDSVCLPLSSVLMIWWNWSIKSDPHSPSSKQQWIIPVTLMVMLMAAAAVAGEVSVVVIESKSVEGATADVLYPSTGESNNNNCTDTV